MSVERAEPGYVANPWSEEEEIDLRKYLNVLLRWWREILFITLATIVLVALAVEALKLVLAPKYEASASVAIVRTFSDVSFDPRFKTQTDDANAVQANSASSRRSALLALASSASIAQKVIEQLGDKLTAKERVAETLTKAVTAELASGGRSGGDSDLINIMVKADSPEKAALIVNTWSQIYVQSVNAIYGQVPDDLLTSIESEYTNVQKNYEKSQTELEAFVADNHIDTLSRQITETQSVIDNLQRGKKDALTQLVNDIVTARSQAMQDFLNTQANSQVNAYKKELEGRQALLTAYLNAINDTQVNVFKQQADRDNKLLNNYYTTWQQATRALDDANNLKAQVEKGGDGAARSSTLALQLLKLQVFTQIFTNETSLGPTDNKQPVDENSLRLQLQVGDNTPVLTQEQMMADLNALINVLTQRRQDLEKQITALSTRLLNGGNYNELGKTIPVNSQLVQSIQAQYAKLRDPSWLSTITTTLATSATLATISPTVASAAPPMLADSHSVDVASMDDVSQKWAEELLQLKGLANVSTSGGNDMVAQTVMQLEKDKLSLKAQLEAEKARQLRLTQQRDLNWDTLKTLSNKVAELNLARAANGSEVRLAAPAVVPVDPVERLNLLLALAAAAVVGLMLAIIITALAEYIGKEPFLGRQSGASQKAAAGV